ncbi:MAG: tRNA (adenosine(37)-N6)-dimethylallyltransferase MiaA [Clostridia bacterium]|nr:tRNA (adenosine(37)-N6)-dimethylallyltransferase MiaA [Clostridia bacterium]
MQKVIIITGFTGSGKSGLAVDIAKKYNGEIISCDSVQVYKGLDIGSAKVTKEEMQGIPHHLIDIVEPAEDYSVGQFIGDCENALKEIIAKGKTPIIVGGTGLYIKALMQGYNFSNAQRNDEFRQQQFKLAELHGNDYVWQQLNDLSPQKAKTVHPNNIKRVVRYLEIAKFGEDTGTIDGVLSKYNTLCVGVIADRQLIYDKINRRVDIMIDQGLEQEVKGLLDSGLTLDNNCMNTIGYREMAQYLLGQIDYEKSIELIKQHTRNYCKRQLTFMKTMPNLVLADKEKARGLIEEFLNDNIK